MRKWIKIIGMLRILISKKLQIIVRELAITQAFGILSYVDDKITFAMTIQLKVSQSYLRCSKASGT